MRNDLSLNKKIGKRTYTLKELAQRDFVAPAKTKANDAPRFTLVNIQEDLLGEIEDQLYQSDQANQVKEVNSAASSAESRLTPKSLSLPIELLGRLINKEIIKTAQLLDLEESELQAWIDLQVMVPARALLSLLRLAREYHLDPLAEEVALALYEDTHWQAYITVEGYSKILNNHPAFDGIAFSESADNTNGIPVWMECSIYRKDRALPTVIREYFEEVKGGQAIWQKMPRRMLRHRVMQQCARLAVG
jgi:hypothetical protein